MHKNKSNFHPGALELGQKVEGSSNIKLAGIQALIDCDEYISLGADEFTSECKFKNAVGVDYRCYYSLQQVYKNETNLHERGVGTIFQKGREFFLRRDFPVAWGDHANTLHPVKNFDNPTSFDGPGHIRASSLIPPTYIEALASPYSVIASIHPFIPTPVEIEENSLLGRIGNVIQSIDMDELREMTSIGDDAIKALEDTQKQLQLKARRVDLTRKDAVLSAPILRVTPKYTTATRPKAQQGSIIFNTDTKCLEFFDGHHWLLLKGHPDGAL